MQTSTAHPAATGLPISGRTLLFPVVGNPVTQVQAPAVFNPLFAQAGIDALVVPLQLPAAAVVATCRALLQSDSVGGLLVTVPYKQQLFELVDDASAEAQLVRGVNAIRRRPDGRVAGAMLDGDGFVRGLRHAGHEPAGRRVLIVGAGGAGSAIAAALAAAGVAELCLFDPRPAVAAGLAATLRQRFAPARFTAVESAAAGDHDIVVNASPLGMQPTDALPLDPAALRPGTLVADVIMKPAETELLRQARRRGLPTHPGQPMLDHQTPAYLDFFGFPAAARLAASRFR